MGDDDTEEAYCDKCEKAFLIHSSISINYESRIADCLNGSPHKFKKVIRYPELIGDKEHWRCEDCGKIEYRL